MLRNVRQLPALCQFLIAGGPQLANALSGIAGELNQLAHGSVDIFCVLNLGATNQPKRPRNRSQQHYESREESAAAIRRHGEGNNYQSSNESDHRPSAMLVLPSHDGKMD